MCKTASHASRCLLVAVTPLQQVLDGRQNLAQLCHAVVMLGDELMQGVHAVVMLRHQLMEGCLGRDKRVLGALQRVHTFGMVIKMLAITTHGAVMQELGTLQQRQAVEVA